MFDINKYQNEYNLQSGSEYCKTMKLLEKNILKNGLKQTPSTNEDLIHLSYVFNKLSSPAVFYAHTNK